MKLITIALIFVILCAFTQDNDESKLKIAPPGTVWFKENVYIDMFPITNSDYAEMLASVVDYYSELIHDTIQKLPLCGVNEKKIYSYFYEMAPSAKKLKFFEQDFNLPLTWTSDTTDKVYYYDSFEYQFYPAINISYDQALEFCKWRTDMVMLNYAIAAKNEKQRSQFYKKIKYRLPTKEEWELAVKEFDVETSPYTKPVLNNGEDDIIMFHYRPGNIAEMTSVKGVAIGSSWKDKLDIGKFCNIQKYDGPSDWLGFRCVCEVVEF